MMPPLTLPSFKNPALLQRAFTHRSYLNEHAEETEDNERLEFLGDAVLDFLSGAFLYHRYPEMREGPLTRLRAALVKTEQLAIFAQQLDLGPQLRMGRGEAETGGRQREALLCDAFEAVIGAYFLDAGVEAVRQFIEPLFAATVEAILTTEADQDAKSLLQEWAQRELSQTPFYKLVEASGPDHQKEFTVQVYVGEEVYGVGSGRNKQIATRRAAVEALKKAGLA